MLVTEIDRYLIQILFLYINIITKKVVIERERVDVFWFTLRSLFMVRQVLPYYCYYDSIFFARESVCYC